MKKFLVSVGLATAGAAAFHTSSMAQSSLLGNPKVWNVSAELDGFYDDNFVTASSKKGGYGTSFSPTFSADIPLTQTEIGVLYTYGLQYYNDRQAGDVWGDFDQTHSLNLWLDHSFNERWNVKISDNFVDGQDPELLNSAGTGGSPLRLEGNNWNDNALVDLHTEWSRLFSSDLSYGFGVYEYSEQGAHPSAVTPGNPIPYYSVYTGQPPGYPGYVPGPSYAGTLNRIQNSVNLDLQWHLSPETTLSAGYQFSLVEYIGNEVVGFYNNPYSKSLFPAISYYSANRDNYSHIGYVGVQESLLASLVVAARVGVQYNDDYNLPDGDSQDPYSTTPYANISLIYTYLPDCTAQIGFTQTRNATDVVSVNQAGGNGSLTLSTEASSLFASINHHITSKLLISLIGSWTESSFEGGAADAQNETMYGVGASASYAFTRHFSANVNYTFDDLTAPVSTDPNYTRNRISIGMSLSY